MRNIKFRAWFKEDQEIKEVAMNNVYTGNKGYLYLSLSPMSNYKEIELMQWTGLKDKHGMEIFEGDILAINKTRYVVGYSEYSGGWQLEINNEYCAEMVQGNCDLLEIIGNVYENNELLDA